jgi:hypothetical protein
MRGREAVGIDVRDKPLSSFQGSSAVVDTGRVFACRELHRVVSPRARIERPPRLGRGGAKPVQHGHETGRFGGRWFAEHEGARRSGHEGYGLWRNGSKNLADRLHPIELGCDRADCGDDGACGGSLANGANGENDSGQTDVMAIFEAAYGGPPPDSTFLGAAYGGPGLIDGGLIRPYGIAPPPPDRGPDRSTSSDAGPSEAGPKDAAAADSALADATLKDGEATDGRGADVRSAMSEGEATGNEAELRRL